MILVFNEDRSLPTFDLQKAVSSMLRLGTIYVGISTNNLREGPKTYYCITMVLTSTESCNIPVQYS